MAEKEYIDKVAFNYAIREAVKKYPNSFYNGLEVARQIAHDLPTADVRPVVRGKWIPHYEDFDAYDGGVEKRQWGFECSICGRWEENAEPFCNCGAMMEES